MEIKRVLVVYTLEDVNSKKTINSVGGILKKKCVAYFLKLRSKLRQKDFLGKELIIAVGGDGTFLKTAHYIKNKVPLLGINSNPEKKLGFFMAVTSRNFKEVFERILRHNYKKIKLNRLEASINNKKINELCLNEVYAGFKEICNVAKYELNYGKIRETQRSSGILAGPAAGSSAWIKSAGGKALPLNSKKFQFVVRDPIKSRISSAKVVKKILRQRQILRIKSLADGQVVVVDTLSRYYPLNTGDVLEIKASKNPLVTFSF